VRAEAYIGGMKRLTHILAATVLTLGFSDHSWADQIFECTGEQGEPMFAARPCDQMSAPSSAARYASHDRRLEQVKVELVAVKQRQMSVDREHNLLMAEASAEEKPELVERYQQQSKALKAELYELHRIQTELVGASCETLMEARAEL
jgi:hypothetical protein